MNPACACSKERMHYLVPLKCLQTDGRLFARAVDANAPALPSALPRDARPSVSARSAVSWICDVFML